MTWLGIDIGSLYLGWVALDEGGSLVGAAYRRHQGEPARTLLDSLSELGSRTGPIAIARTGSGASGVPLPGTSFDPVIAGLEGVRHQAPDARHVLSMGGGSFFLVETDKNGEYRRSMLNSACASGTGAFLDQQALRLQIQPEELSALAEQYDQKPPAVATRCAVFAKSDLIHLQQDGFPVAAIAAGLCRGLGYATVDGLLGGRRLEGKTALIGGVALNRVVSDAAAERLGSGTVALDRPELAGAWGAALLAGRQDETASVPSLAELLERLQTLVSTSTDKGNGAPGSPGSLRAPLRLKKSEYPDFVWAEHRVDQAGNETALPSPCSGRLTVALGLDIGSTSTKAVWLDEQNDVVGWVYRKTAGDPIGAVQQVFRAFRELQDRSGFQADIQGVGVTGSGRKMIGRVIGSDLVLNEITAHATAALFLDPSVDTIIELGGQDAKFTQLQNGMVYNSVMNYVCAAGTGSFIEEQAQKLGIPLEAFADLALGCPAPRTSDRCTVYMERDLDRLLAAGWDKAQVAAAVLHSVRDNYLNKVVGGLHIGDHICFQGATARNRALVAAFEVGLDRPIRVSSYCHLTGALGMALLVRERVPERQRSVAFKGLGFADAEIRLEQETCTLCRNECRLTLIHGADGETVAWGLKCGRDYASRRPVVEKNPGYDYWARRNKAWSRSGSEKASPDPSVPSSSARPRVGLPRALGGYGYYPFWRAFLESLGCDVVTGRPSSDDILRRGREVATAEVCAPVLMSQGHVQYLLSDENVDFVWVPHAIEAATPDPGVKSYFCPYVQAHPSVLKALRGLERPERILAPVFSFSGDPDAQAAALVRAAAEPLGVDGTRVRAALSAAKEAQQSYWGRAQALGREAMREVEQNRTLGLVCVGRPYNTADPGLTLDLPRKTALMGYTTLPLDMWPVAAGGADAARSRNMYWHYGQRILAAVESLAKNPRWFAIYFTHFMCGPDSYLLTYVKDIMARAGKPYLCLQLDGHGADAGYLTRIEAALETFHAWSGIAPPGSAGVGGHRDERTDGTSAGQEGVSS